MKHSKKKIVRSPRVRPAPLAAPGPSTVSQASDPSRDAAPLRIVLVEDSAMDVALIDHQLRATGRNITLTVTETCASYEAELHRCPPDLILSDYTLPTFDGRQALEIARRLVPNVPFIFVTGTMGEEVAIDLLKQGATDYVLKNRLGRLTPAVDRALTESVLRREHIVAEENLQRSHDQLRALTGHLQFVREEERTRIAREVHDELGQALTGLRLDLSWLSGKFHGARAPQRKIKTMAAQIDATIQAIRRIATELRPGVLDNLGLAAAIEWQAAEFQERTGIRCALTIKVTETMWEREFSTACFRIFQETLTNIARHADATEVEVRLTREGADLVLAVRDDGCGITEKEVLDAGSIGLIGMKERAAQVGGTMSFTGPRGGGSLVTLRVPLTATVAALAQAS